MMAAGLDVKPTGSAFSACLPPTLPLTETLQKPVPEIGGFEALSRPAGKVWGAKTAASSEQKAMPPEELQEVLWKHFFADTTQWWDNRRSKPTSRHPDFRHKESRVPMWLNNKHKPVWVDSQLAKLDAGMMTTVDCGSSSIQGHGGLPPIEGHLEMEMCRKSCEDGLISDAVDALDLLVQRGCHVPNNLFYRVLKRCTQDKGLVLGRRIHDLTIKSGYDGDAFLATHLIGMYASHQRLDEAMRVFTNVSTPDSYNWATIIFAYARHGGATEAAEAVRLYRQMSESTTVKPDDRIYLAVLKACAAATDLIAGKKVHAHILASQRKPDKFVEAALVHMYAKCGSLDDARSVLQKLPERNIVACNAMLAGYTQHGMAKEALSLYRSMQQEGLTPPNSVTYVCLLQACASEGVGALDEGKKLHAQIEKQGLHEHMVLGGSLVNMYAQCGSIEDARIVFDKLSARDVVTWTAMIAGYTQQGLGLEALSLYKSMQQEALSPPDNVAYVCLLQACAGVGIGALDEGKQLHAQIKERGLHEDVVVGGSLVNMYAKCGRLPDARSVFDTLKERNVVACNAMLAGYAQQGMGREALSLYRTMQQEGLTPPDCVTFVSLLQACASVGGGALHEGKQLHALIIERGLQEDVVLHGSLVNMYAKCGSLEDARRLFDKLPEKNVVVWNSMIAAYAQHCMGQEALCLHSCMQEEGLTPDCVTYVSLLQACAGVGPGALDEGKQLHGEIKERGLQVDVVLLSSLVNMYAKCGSLEDARSVFDKLPERDTVACNVMLAGYAQQGMGQEALSLYRDMQQNGPTPPDCVTYVCLLQALASGGVGALHEGKQLHAQIEERGLLEDVVLGGSLVNMYVKCGSLEDARRLFDKLPERNVVAWNAMIAGYAQQGMGPEALNLYSSMQQEGLTPPSTVTYGCLLQACASVGVGALHVGKHLHAQIKEQGLQEDVVIGGSLVNMYAKCGCLQDARVVFDKLSDRDVVTWTALIAGYAQQGMGLEALSLYRNLQQDGLPPNSITFVSLLQACASVGVGALHEGKQLHAQIKEQGLEEDVVLGGSLVNMHAKCGSLEDARSLFDKLQERDVVAWNAMIAAYAQQGMGHEALSLYSCMQQEGLTPPDCVTYVCLLQACASVGIGALHMGKQLHSQIKELGLEEDVFLAGSLVNMYAKCDSLEGARRLFDQLPERNLVAWNAMIAGYAQQGMGQEAIGLYRRMQQAGHTPDSVTFVCLLQACAAVAALPLGEQLHVEIKEQGMQADSIVGAALVNMYAKCGSMFASQQVFDSLPERSVEVWGALVSGYARQGDDQVVFDLLDRMRLEGVKPNDATFLGVLTVCSHVGLVDKGREYYEAMRTVYGINATVEHYICMVDLLGRAGHLDEALQMAKTMPFPPNDVVWHTLLGACRKWKNVKIGQQAFESAVRMDEKDAASYVLMSNIYASAEMWEAAKEMQARRKKLGAWKKPGQSRWTDMDGLVHTFLVGDKKHPESEGIYARLEKLVPKIKKEGYVPHLQSSLLDLPDDEKEAELCGHSEKLAIAYALNKTAEGTTITIVKNLRVCEDCHTATAYISKVEKRIIICRDASRFHIFKEGRCSCGDYW